MLQPAIITFTADEVASIRRIVDRAAEVSSQEVASGLYDGACSVIVMGPAGSGVGFKMTNVASPDAHIARPVKAVLETLPAGFWWYAEDYVFFPPTD
jgi:hypothetical protein